jgi:hypothetical protein
MNISLSPQREQVVSEQKRFSGLCQVFPSPLVFACSTHITVLPFFPCLLNDQQASYITMGVVNLSLSQVVGHIKMKA